MSESPVVHVESLDDGVRVLVLDRPPVNALGRQLVSELERALAGLAADAAARCVIVRSAQRHFCGGADLKERRGMTRDEARAFVPRLAGVCNAIAGLAAAGGGCELALACDLRILASDTTIGLRETALAIIPGAGGTQRLPRLIGPARAKRWIFTARMHTAAEALADGVADRVVRRSKRSARPASAACEPPSRACSIRRRAARRRAWREHAR
jgi:methylglutaconyl-CoA hydratase